MCRALPGSRGFAAENPVQSDEAKDNRKIPLVRSPVREGCRSVQPGGDANTVRSAVPTSLIPSSARNQGCALAVLEVVQRFSRAFAWWNQAQIKRARVASRPGRLTRGKQRRRDQKLPA